MAEDDMAEDVMGEDKVPEAYNDRTIMVLKRIKCSMAEMIKDEMRGDDVNINH